MEIQFFDDPGRSPRTRDDVRFNQLGLYVHPGGRQVAVGFDITPFLERPSIEVTITNERQQVAATLTVIEAMNPNFSITMHLRDREPTEAYEVDASLYYISLETGEKLVIDRLVKTLDVTQEGEQ
jgi:hypothetical protein